MKSVLPLGTVEAVVVIIVRALSESALLPSEPSSVPLLGGLLHCRSAPPSSILPLLSSLPTGLHGAPARVCHQLLCLPPFWHIPVRGAYEVVPHHLRYGPCKFYVKSPKSSLPSSVLCKGNNQVWQVVGTVNNIIKVDRRLPPTLQ